MNVIETKSKRWFPEGSSLVIGPALGLLLWVLAMSLGWFARGWLA